MQQVITSLNFADLTSMKEVVTFAAREVYDLEVKIKQVSAKLNNAGQYVNNWPAMKADLEKLEELEMMQADVRKYLLSCHYYALSETEEVFDLRTAIAA